MFPMLVFWSLFLVVIEEDEDAQTVIYPHMAGAAAFLGQSSQPRALCY